MPAVYEDQVLFDSLCVPLLEQGKHESRWPLTVVEDRRPLVVTHRGHGRAHDLVYLELEVRQDLIDAPDKAAAVAQRIARALAIYAPPGWGEIGD